MGLKRTKLGRSIAGTELGAKVGSMARKGNLNGLEVWEIDRRNWVPSERRREQGTKRVSSDRSGPEWVGSAQVLIHEARFCGSGVRIGPMLDSPQLFAGRRSDGKLWPRAIANGEYNTDSMNLSSRLQETQWPRRATRQILSKTKDRRTSLNTRFVHLASLLSSLAEVHRPSKAAVVESSIAYVHSAREHRTLASCELQALHIENQSLCREVNQWRARAGLDANVEPRRSDLFVLVLTGDMPEIHSDPREPKEHTNDMLPPSEEIHQRSSLQSPLAATSNFRLPDDSPRNSISRESSPHSIGDSMDWTNTIAPQTVAYHNTSQSSLDGLSAAESGESVNSSFSSSSWAEWNLPSYHVLAHRLILQELDLTGTVTRLDTYPVDSGGSADIYGGILGMPHWQSTQLSRRQVAIKIYRRLPSEPQELEQTSTGNWTVNPRLQPSTASAVANDLLLFPFWGAGGTYPCLAPLWLIGYAVYMYNTFYRVGKQNTVKQRHNAPEDWA
ncbi:hypothetical protein DFH08DRAFT_1051267 [Mycena albidolilacea]|uniref:BHLH domain-containing protein n=1 Tax=Mycena albidolilacea TaxID=1033008 RepID=A0AAD6Z5A7_9AGAR|nr:hypothetical protein DFH08DRAFT_1051267 [Mycena albidolilacea]